MPQHGHNQVQCLGTPVLMCKRCHIISWYKPSAGIFVPTKIWVQQLFQKGQARPTCMCLRAGTSQCKRSQELSGTSRYKHWGTAGCGSEKPHPGTIFSQKFHCSYKGGHIQIQSFRHSRFQVPKTGTSTRSATLMWSLSKAILDHPREVSSKSRAGRIW